MLGADERILEREVAIFEALRQRVAAEAPRIQDTARGLATLDVLSALAETAAAQNYTKPHDARRRRAAGRRRPPSGRRTPRRRRVRSRTTSRLTPAARQLIVLTGPNMGGKSTYLRQTALLCADGAGRVVRAGAQRQAADRRPHFRPRRRVRQHRARPVDVHGRDAGDGQHPAQRDVAEPADPRRDRPRHRRRSTVSASPGPWRSIWRPSSRARPKTIFATHYHELTDLADALPNVANYHVVVREWQDDIVFLRKVVPGRSDRSYGIQVARLAGSPAIGRRARARDPQRPRARRAVARRTAVVERRRRATPAAGSSGCSRRRPRPTIRCVLRLKAARRRQPDAASGAVAPRRPETRGWRMSGRAACTSALAALSPCRRAACARRETRRRRDRRRDHQLSRSTSIRASAPTRSSQKAHQLLYNTLVRIDDELRIVPELAESLAAAGCRHVRGDAAPGRAVSQRPRADGGRRRLHVPELPRSVVPRPVRRVSAAGVGRARSIATRSSSR